jgi:hypothetical protein
MIDNILANIPDKRFDKNTTSHKFKRDLIEFFQGKDLLYCIEVGTNVGYSTRLLSMLFNRVTTIDNDIHKIRQAIEFNSDRTNIEFLVGDVYTSDWGIESPADVIFIDAIHTYEHVLQDISNAINYSYPGAYMVFDDYGLPTLSGVKQAIDEMIDNKTLTFITHVGEHKGDSPRPGIPLVDREGIITMITK